MLHDHDPILVVLSFVTAFFAAFTAFHTGERIKMANGSARFIWLGLAGVAMGGGIWSMHFIAMLAMRMDISVTYDIGLTFLSLAVAIGVTGLGFFILTRDSLLPQQPIIRLFISGGVMGGGVAAMHYTGMAAMNMAALIHYDPILVTVSVLIAMVASTVALWLTLNVDVLWQRLASSLVMALAVCGMHYTAMAASTFTAADCAADGGLDLAPLPLAITVAAGTCVILLITLISTTVDRRMTEARLAEINAQLLETIHALEIAHAQTTAADRAKADFLANMNHELRTPLNAIIGFSELLRAQTLGPLGNPTYTNYADYIHMGGSRLMNVLDHIFEVVRLQSGGVALDDNLTDLMALADHTVQRTRDETPYDTAHITTSLHANVPPIVLCDRTLIRRALGNIIENAIKYSPPHSPIEIGVRTYGDGHASIHIKDRGEGIATADINRILTPFGHGENTLARRHQGAGLGLTLAKLYIELHGGWLEIISEPKNGTIVSLHFPPLEQHLAVA